MPPTSGTSPKCLLRVSGRSTSPMVLATGRSITMLSALTRNTKVGTQKKSNMHGLLIVTRAVKPKAPICTRPKQAQKAGNVPSEVSPVTTASALRIMDDDGILHPRNVATSKMYPQAHIDVFTVQVKAIVKPPDIPKCLRLKNQAHACQPIHFLDASCGRIVRRRLPAQAPSCQPKYRWDAPRTILDIAPRRQTRGPATPGSRSTQSTKGKKLSEAILRPD